MKTRTLMLAGMAMTGFATGALAQEGNSAEAFEEGCIAYHQGQDGSEELCGCIADKMADDEEFANEMMSVAGPDGIDALSEESRDKIAECEMGDE